MRLPLFCCCDPAKLIGSVEVPEPLAVDGARCAFPLNATFEADRYDRILSKEGWAYGALRKEESVTLDIGWHATEKRTNDGRVVSRRRILAVKSTDQPEEVLERIVSFKKEWIG